MKTPPAMTVIAAVIAFSACSKEYPEGSPQKLEKTSSSSRIQQVVNSDIKILPSDEIAKLLSDTVVGEVDPHVTGVFEMFYGNNRYQHVSRDAKFGFWVVDGGQLCIKLDRDGDYSCRLVGRSSSGKIYFIYKYDEKNVSYREIAVRDNNTGKDKL